MTKHREEMLLVLSLDKERDIMELSVVDTTVKGGRANQLLYPLAMGISVILEEDPSLLYEAGTELYNGDVYVDMESNTQH